MKFFQYFILKIKNFLVTKNDNLDNPSEMGEDLIYPSFSSLFMMR